MRRKLVKQGPSSLTVSLPKEWTERFGLKGGEDVNIEEVNAELIVSSLNRIKSANTTTYDLTGLPDSKLMRDIMVSIYKQGIKDVTFTGLSSKKMVHIKEVVQNTIGFEIINETKDSLHIVDLGTADEQSMAQAENQIYWKLLNMLEQVKNTSVKYEELKKVDREVNRLAFYIQRNLSANFSKGSNNFIRYEKIGILENLGDTIRYFKKYHTVTSKEIKFLSQIAVLLDKLRPTTINMEQFTEIDASILSLMESSEKLAKGKNKEGFQQIFLIKSLNELFEITFALNINNLKGK
ncbi:MAG: AbrB/MazE/SpoVT family DNA-binding domain-containing protein [archaeon]